MILFFMTCTSLLVTVNSAPNAPDSCSYFFHTYKNGEVFTSTLSKCLKYKCNRGVTELIEEGCEVEDKCYKVNSTFVDGDCNTYKCSKTGKDGSTSYDTSIIQTLCADLDGKCHKPGEKFRTKSFGRIVNNCTCKVIRLGEVSITCQR